VANRVVMQIGWDHNLDGPIDVFLEHLGSEMENDAKAACPVDTGHLRESLEHEVQDDTLRVGSNVKYAVYVEEGTRHMHAQPYLRPALYRQRAQ